LDFIQNGIKGTSIAIKLSFCSLEVESFTQGYFLRALPPKMSHLMGLWD